MGTLRLVQEAKTIRDEENETRRSKGLPVFEQVWCVFDLDDNRLNYNNINFEKALQLANAEKMRVAYSNDAFELWYVLHFDYLQSQAHRSGYITMLEKPNLLNRKYSKMDGTMYDVLFTRQNKAVENAKRLLAEHHPSHLPASEKNPSTTVHELVLELNKYVRS